MPDIKVGDPVLFYGKSLAVSAIDDKVATVVDPVAVAGRDENRVKILALREQQAKLKGDDHAAIAAQIFDLDTAHALMTVKLRKDLLTWWDERKVWVSEGRILSEDQLAAFVKLTGGNPRPDAHRAALKVVEALG